MPCLDHGTGPFATRRDPKHVEFGESLHETIVGNVVGRMLAGKGRAERQVARNGRATSGRWSGMREERELHAVGRPDASVSISPGCCHRWSDLFCAGRHELARGIVAARYLEREPHRPGDTPARLDAVDHLGLSLIEQLEGCAPGVEKDHPTVVGAPVRELVQSELVTVEGNGLLEVSDGESDPQLAHTRHETPPIPLNRGFPLSIRTESAFVGPDPHRGAPTITKPPFSRCPEELSGTDRVTAATDREPSRLHPST